MVLEEKLRKLEEECKQREAERVSLELELTEVKESLRKALAGGVTLGLAIEPKSGTSSPQVSVLAACARPAGASTNVPACMTQPTCAQASARCCVESIATCISVSHAGDRGCVAQGGS